MAAPKNPARGIDHPNAKLTPDDLRLIKNLVAEREKLLQQAKKLTNAIIAQKFDVHPNTIDRVARRQIYYHV
jgi:hypothetical protein